MYISQSLYNPAGPPDFYTLHDRFHSQAKVNPLVTGRKITARDAYSAELRSLRADYLDLRTDCVPITLMSGQLQGQPMVLGGCLIAQNVGSAIVCGYHEIQPAVVVDVTNCKTTSDPGVLESISRDPRDIHKFSACVSN